MWGWPVSLDPNPAFEGGYTPSYVGLSSFTVDPFENCETKCRHDTVRGVLVAELCGPEDGPYKPTVRPPPQPVIRDNRIQME